VESSPLLGLSEHANHGTEKDESDKDPLKRKIRGKGDIGQKLSGDITEASYESTNFHSDLR
jgi:hypothetical protein